jgi:hypothetical protein
MAFRWMCQETGSIIETSLTDDQVLTAVKFWEAKVGKRAHISKPKTKIKKVIFELALQRFWSDRIGMSEDKWLEMQRNIIKYYSQNLGLSHTTLWRIRKRMIRGDVDYLVNLLKGKKISVGDVNFLIKEYGLDIPEIYTRGYLTTDDLEMHLSKRRKKRFL